MVGDSQGPGSDHQHGANKGRHHLNSEKNFSRYFKATDLEEVGNKMSNKGRKGEHQEYHQEAHAAPDTCEVGINTTESELAALIIRE